jgi:hypothetical protein
VGRQQLEIIFGRVLLLYQMPKAGSQTVEATLRLCRLPHRIVRLHFLSAENGKRINGFISERSPQGAWQSAADGQMKLLTDMTSALRMRKMLVACKVPLRRIEVITAVRDVLGVALSCIFQNYRLFAQQPKDLTVEKCRELLIRPKMCTQFLDWFDTELRATIGLNVYKKPFPTERGYCQYENALARVLLYRFEELPRLGPALEQFLGCDVPPLVNRNLGVVKEYGEVYQQVRNSITLPPDFVSRLLKSALMKHFYSNEERDSLKRKWSDTAQTSSLRSSRSSRSLRAWHA